MIRPGLSIPGVKLRQCHPQPRLTKACTTWLLVLVATYSLFRLWAHSARRAKDLANVYGFYAHDDSYACSVLVNAHLLRSVHHTRHRIVTIVSSRISGGMLDAMRAANITLFEDTPLPLFEGAVGYYDGCLLKLAAFKLHEFDPSIRRVLAMDADQLILRNLDHVFDLNPRQDFMAPNAYWLANGTIASTCMLIRPGPAIWDLVRSAAENITSNEYDMDLINRLFAGDGQQRLSSSYVTLNSHWEDRNVPRWFEGPEGAEREAALVHASDQHLHALQDQAAIVHFTAFGKPWMASTGALLQGKPNVHPIMAEQWMEWRSIAMEKCPAGTITGL